jgi:hypothetical protein
MNEIVWFLSAVINGRFSVTSIIANDEEEAVNQAVDHLIHTSLIPLIDFSIKPMVDNASSAVITTKCGLVASLIKS